MSKLKFKENGVIIRENSILLFGSKNDKNCVFLPRKLVKFTLENDVYLLDIPSWLIDKIGVKTLRDKFRFVELLHKNELIIPPYWDENLKIIVD